MAKVRVEANITTETKHLLDQILASELEADRREERPERSNSEILEMVLRKGVRTWKQEREPVAMKIRN